MESYQSNTSIKASSDMGYSKEEQTIELINTQCALCINNSAARRQSFGLHHKYIYITSHS